VDDYFIPGAREALDFFRKRGFELVLITHGDKYWQGFKLKQLKINRYFSKCIITEGDKIRELGFLKGAKGEVVFINDDPEELYHMGRAFPEARTFLVYGPYSEKVKDKKVYQISDLPEILCK
jgi:FMN phosphatase YigB (HAD superfamily)